jgi:hypothetical protein
LTHYADSVRLTLQVRRGVLTSEGLVE